MSLVTLFYPRIDSFFFSSHRYQPPEASPQASNRKVGASEAGRNKPNGGQEEKSTLECGQRVHAEGPGGPNPNDGKKPPLKVRKGKQGVFQEVSMA